MAQLSADCLNEVFEYLEDDMINLHSCLLVNHLWCNVSVRIFWRNSRNYKTSNLRTLIACLPNESKEILNNNEIIISTPTSKPPMFNYASFCKSLLICKVDKLLRTLLLNDKFNKKSDNLSNNMLILTQEIIKLFFNQIGSLKKLKLWEYPKKINFYHGAKACLKNLSELRCMSNFSPEFFYQLSQICHNISLLNITIEKFISKELIDLTSAQKNLQSFKMTQYSEPINLNSLNSLIEKLPNTLIKLNLILRNHISLLFIARFTNLQELNFCYSDDYDFIDFEKLQNAIFPNLQILNIQGSCPNLKSLIKFLENNGNNLKECYIGDETYYIHEDSLNLTIAKFCPNLRKLSVWFQDNELETMKIIFNNCQYLESITVWCGYCILSDKEVLELVVKYSHKNFYEIIFNYVGQYLETETELLPEELESFLINWTNRVPQKSLSFVIRNLINISYGIDGDDNMKIINKYIELGVIKRFKVSYY
ncbi:hypothetical protein C1645_829324 [Glomus cerebriforme]|uniref:F-box domain-containing protein n=1 Tax=Glomus cerebriforme TaxID=658196 RepID=A0A397SQV1_9GLOM|nr:hypothetical protein C1645_829324 [Glomus cerebriforme]